MSKVLVAIDGGGTSSKVAVAKVADLSSSKLPSPKSIRTFHVDSPFNVATLGPDEVPTVLRRIAKETGISFKDVAFLFCGLDGIDHPIMAQLVLEHARSVQMRRNTPIIVKNDLFVGLRAEYRPGQATGVLISGTGTNCGIESSHGRLTQVSGTAWLLGDERRSGNSLGRRALSWMMEEFQIMGVMNTIECRDVARLGKRSGSILLKLLSEKVSELYQEELKETRRRTAVPDKFRQWIDGHMYADEKLGRIRDSDRVRFAGQFARPAVEAARRGDSMAIRWALELAKQLAELLEKTARAADDTPARVALVGGMIAPRGIIQRAFRDQVRGDLRKPPVFVPYASGEQLVSKALIGAVAHHRDGGR